MIALPAVVIDALTQLEQAGFSAYAVGGGVRDRLRGLAPDDWDLTTSAQPHEVMQVFSHVPVRETGLQHGTVTVILQNIPLEITTYRTEQGYADGRHPDAVQFVRNITDDLARRDFTVNAIAYSPTRGFCDPFGGRADLSARVLRCVGDPVTRFTEDSLRILRGLRFASTTGFSLDRDTVHGMRKTMHLMRQLAPERVRVELCKLLVGRDVGRVLRAYRDILAIVLPEISPMFGMAQHTRHHVYDIWEHTVCAVELSYAEMHFRWALLLHDCGKPSCFTIDMQGNGHFYGHPAKSAQIATQIFARLRFSSEDSTRLLRLIARHDDKPPHTPEKMRRALSQQGEQELRDLLHIARCDTIARGKSFAYLAHLRACTALLDAQLLTNDCLHLSDLALDGNDLYQLGLRGKQIGTALQELLDFVLTDPTRNTRAQLILHLQEEETR